jgi:hypothetical protein
MFDLKFKLPVGALINGWVHIGEGEFVTDKGMSSGLGYPPDIIEVFTDNENYDDSDIMLEKIEPIFRSGFRKIVLVKHD